MTSAQFKLDMFEGPLDLLLHLITKHKLNIYDIEITVLLEQYLEYMDSLEHEDYEDAADFLEMAARLIYIKTVSLLPSDDEAQELKQELQGKIIEYSLIKLAAQKLRDSYAGGDIFVREPVKLPVNKTFTGEREAEELLLAYMGMSEKARHSKPLKADMFKGIVSHRVVSVTSKIIYILKKLYTTGKFSMDRLYDGMTDKSERVATFLAVLELTKSGRIFLSDDNSQIFMNKKAKKGQIASDFDKAQEPESGGEIVSGKTAEEETAEETADEAAQEITEEAVVQAEETAAEAHEEETLQEPEEEAAQDIAQVKNVSAEDISEAAQEETSQEAEEEAVSLEEIAETVEPREQHHREHSVTYRSKSEYVQGDALMELEETAAELDKLMAQQDQPTEAVMEEAVQPAEDTDYIEEQTGAVYCCKKDLFGKRYYWGTPDTGNCWGYYRNRIG